MKYNFENEYLTASTDSTAVAKRLILIIEDMEKLEEEKYAHDENGNRIPRHTPNINGEYNLPAQPFKGAIVVDDLEDYSKMLQKRVKPDTPAMNITSRLHEEPADSEDEFVNHCVKQQAAKIKPAKGEKWPHEKFTSDEYPPENTDAEDIEIEDEPEERVPEQIDASTTGDVISNQPNIPAERKPKDADEIEYPKKVKASEIKPCEGTVEEAYMGEHFEVVPDEPEEKPLTPAEQELWDYIQKNPQYTMTSACRDLHITTANYYWRKRQLFLKGRKVGGTIAFAKKAED